MSNSYLSRQLDQLVQKLKDMDIASDRVIELFRVVKRENFVAPIFVDKAYIDMTLPTSDNQTISQPSVVAQMTELLDVQPMMNVLEIGTGSGFQAAILSKLTERTIYTIERIPSLATSARERFRQLGFNNIICRTADGTKGMPDKAPFDRIIVTAGAPIVPNSLVDQLKVGGKLLIPRGDSEKQFLELYTKNEDNQLLCKKFNTLSFVPLIGEEGWR